jgi:hypothetical protein
MTSSYGKLEEVASASLAMKNREVLEALPGEVVQVNPTIQSTRLLIV